MTWNNVWKALLFPPVALLLFSLPSSVAGLFWAFTSLNEIDLRRIGIYIWSFYTLIIWCLRMPAFIRSARTFRNENRYANRWLNDTRLRINATLAIHVIWNSSYAVLQLGLGLRHRKIWFYALAVYYFFLAFMRFFLVCHTIRYKPGEKIRQELFRYRVCGWVFLLMNLALSVLIWDMIRQNHIVKYHEITTIAMAAYTFATLILAIRSVLCYRNNHSPVFSASKMISLAAACVSMLTLEETMLTTFRSETMTPQIQRLFLLWSGAAVSIFIVAMSISMIVKANRTIQYLEGEHEAPRNV